MIELNLNSIKKYLMEGLADCVKFNVTSGYIDVEDSMDFYENLKEKVLIIDKIKEEDNLKLSNVVEYILSMDDIDDKVKYEMIISLPMLFDSFLFFKNLKVDYQTVVSAASFMVEWEDVYA